MRRLSAVLLFLVAGAGLAQSPKPTIWDMEQGRTLWLAVKNNLTGNKGQEYFEKNIKDTEFPRLVGTVIAAAPEEQPRLLRIAIEDGSTVEIALKLGGPLKAPVARGSLVAFRGVPVEFQNDPFLLSMQVSAQGVWTWDPPEK